MPNDFVGDVVVYYGTSGWAWTLRRFTRDSFTHVALRLEEELAESIEWKGGVMIHDLKSPREEYISYEIYTPIGISPLQREAIQYLNEIVPKEYDSRLIAKLAPRYAVKKFDMTDLSTPGKFSCSSRTGMIHEMVGIKVIENLHFSQLAPHHYRLSEKFERTRVWVRELKTSSDIRLEGVNDILPSCIIPPQQELKK
jgi:hypothetical protein